MWRGVLGQKNIRTCNVGNIYEWVYDILRKNEEKESQNVANQVTLNHLLVQSFFKEHLIAYRDINLYIFYVISHKINTGLFNYLGLKSKRKSGPIGSR